MNMFKRKFKINIKKEFVRKRETYNNFNEFIIIIIEIDDAWYDFNLQKKFEKFEFKKAKLFQKKLIKYREKKNYQKTILWRWNRIDEVEFNKKI